MKLIRYPQLNQYKEHSAVTIGNFDGVHLGHQSLIQRAVNIANSNNLQSVVVTMQPLAAEYFAKTNEVFVLTSFRQKFNLLKKLGISVSCFLNFNRRMADISAEDFVKKILIEGLNARYIIIGDDFCFGKNRKGDFRLLKQICSEYGIGVEQMPTCISSEERISSSLIRNLLQNDDFVRMPFLLGRFYSICGKISRGQQLGRQLGYPTINVNLNDRFIPIRGIYCVKVRFANGKEYQGSASIGTRPTVNGQSVKLEVYILDFDKQVYGEFVEVLFYHKLRNEVKFESLQELKRHIYDDVVKTRLFFEEYTETELLREQ